MTQPKPSPLEVIEDVEFNFDLAPWIESLVDEETITQAIKAYNNSYSGGQRDWMRAALTAALKEISHE